jgi:hypothetical protein
MAQQTPSKLTTEASKKPIQESIEPNACSDRERYMKILSERSKHSANCAPVEPSLRPTTH